MLISMGNSNNTDTFSSATSLGQTLAANEQYLHDFFIRHQKTILENTLQEYRTTFLYDNIPLLLGYVCIFVVGLVANCINMYAAYLQIRRQENTVCSKMFFQLALSQLLLILYIIPMDYLWRYNQVWEAGEITCKLLVWIRFYLIVTVAAFTVLQTLVRYMVMKVSIQQNNMAKPNNGDVTNSSGEQSAFINMAGSDTTSTATRLSEVSITGNEETIGNERSPTSFHWRNFLSFISIRSTWGVSRSLSMASIIDHHSGKKKPSFKENRLIFLGWFLPMVLCVPEAFVYKLHVHDHIEGYQQCADIFVPQKELLFPRLFPTREEDLNPTGQNNMEWDYMQHEQVSLLPDINQSGKLESIISTIFNESESEFKQYISMLYNNSDMEDLFFLEESIEQPEEEQAISHLKMLYYLMLQSLTFLVPVCSIIFLNVLVVRCYSTVRKESVTCKCGKQQNGNDKCQLHIIRQWAARQTMLLTMSFGISYVICWLPMSILMASKWKTIIVHPVGNSEPSDSVYDSEFTSYPLTFWTFIEEWAIAWGLLISVINPFLYGFFYISGGSKRRTMDLLNIGNDMNGIVDGQDANRSATSQIRSKFPRFTSIMRRQKDRRNSRVRGKPKPVPIEEKE